MASQPKTPIMIVQELAMAIGLQPTYTMFSEEKSANVFNFTCFANLARFSGKAIGSNKKAAKQLACHNLLKVIDNYGEFFPRQTQIMSKWDREFEKSLIVEEKPKTEGNQGNQSVGELANLLIKLAIAPASYTIKEDRQINGNQHLFFMTCQLIKPAPGVEVVSTVGEGHQKKLAKSDAAAKMLVRLRELRSNLEQELTKLEESPDSEDSDFIKAIDQGGGGDRLDDLLPMKAESLFSSELLFGFIDEKAPSSQCLHYIRQLQSPNPDAAEPFVQRLADFVNQFDLALETSFEGSLDPCFAMKSSTAENFTPTAYINIRHNGYGKTPILSSYGIGKTKSMALIDAFNRFKLLLDAGLINIIHPNE